MNTLKFIYIFLAVILLISFSACEKEIYLDVNDSEPRIVIEAVVAEDSLAWVKITRSINYNDPNVFPHLTGAKVVISDNEGNMDMLEQTSSGIYKSANIYGIQGRTYYLEIEVEDQLFTSVSTMPYAVPIDSLTMYYVPAFEAAFPMVHFTDPEGIENYYKLKLFINGREMPDIFTMTDEDKDGKARHQLIPFDSDYNDENEIETGDIVLVEMQCLDKGAHTFFENLARINSSLANPESNIEGGALGYFSTYTLDRKQIIAE